MTIFLNLKNMDVVFPSKETQNIWIDNCSHIYSAIVIFFSSSSFWKSFCDLIIVLNPLASASKPFHCWGDLAWVFKPKLKLRCGGLIREQMHMHPHDYIYMRHPHAAWPMQLQGFAWIWWNHKYTGTKLIVTLPPS